jgi:hypothetical protein
MPTFRIHNPRNRSDRVLIRLTRSSQGAFIPPPPSATMGLPPPAALPASSAGTSVSLKSKKKVSLQQIQEILKLLQKTKNKDIIALLSSKLAGLVDDDVDIDDTTEEEEVQVEEVPETEAEEEDVLVIEL